MNTSFQVKGLRMMVRKPLTLYFDKRFISDSFRFTEK